jgi:hypothetical protein
MLHSLMMEEENVTETLDKCSVLMPFVAEVSLYLVAAKTSSHIHSNFSFRERRGYEQIQRIGKITFLYF